MLSSRIHFWGVELGWGGSGGDVASDGRDGWGRGKEDVPGTATGIGGGLGGTVGTVDVIIGSIGGAGAGRRAPSVFHSMTISG